MGEAEPFCEPGDLAGYLLGVHACNERGGGSQGVELPLGVLQPPAPLVHRGIDDEVGEWVGVGEHVSQSVGPVVLEDLRRVLPRWKSYGTGIGGERAEQVIRTDGCACACFPPRPWPGSRPWRARCPPRAGGVFNLLCKWGT